MKPGHLGRCAHFTFSNKNSVFNLWAMGSKGEGKKVQQYFSAKIFVLHDRVNYVDFLHCKSFCSLMMNQHNIPVFNDACNGRTFAIV